MSETPATTPAYRTVPRWVYRYLVTESYVESVPAGTLLVDKRRDLVKTWIVLDGAGDMRSFIGERQERCCSECHTMHRLVRDYGHDGDHGEAAPYTPSPDQNAPSSEAAHDA